MVLVSRVLGPAKKGIKYIEYLQSNGSQYIDTGVKGKSTGAKGIKVILDISVSPHQGCGLFGARYSSVSRAFNLFNYEDEIRMDFFASSIYKMHQKDVRTQITMDNNSLLVVQDSGNEEHTFSMASFETPVNLYLFTVNTNGTAYNPGATAKLYGCQIYDKDKVLVRDFKPAKDPDNVECLYDKITEQYFYLQTITSTGA